MESVKYYLQKAVEMDAADIYIIAGQPISFKCKGNIIGVDSERLLPANSNILVQELYSMANREMLRTIAGYDDDFSVSLVGLARFRINIFKQRGSMSAIIRVVKFGIPDYKEIGIPDEIMQIATMTRGMVLVTGPAGSGKSTSLACVVEKINSTRNAHIITIEDPIEYLYKNEKSIVTQREISTDTESYLTALRASLRQAPDVVLIGEMRDLETIRVAMTAAETGHLVISTLHTLGAMNTIDRIIDVFPPEQQQQIRIQLSQVLRAIISQQLIPTVKGDLRPAFEIMFTNTAVKAMIRENRVHQIETVIQSGSSEGMFTMDDYLVEMYQKGEIDVNTALQYSSNPIRFKKKMNI